MNITVIGSGYVGLVTGACFAGAGHIVRCLDSNQSKIDNLKKGILPIYEKKLQSLIKSNYKDVGNESYKADTLMNNLERYLSNMYSGLELVVMN